MVDGRSNTDVDYVVTPWLSCRHMGRRRSDGLVVQLVVSSNWPCRPVGRVVQLAVSSSWPCRPIGLLVHSFTEPFGRRTSWRYRTDDTFATDPRFGSTPSERTLHRRGVAAILDRRPCHGDQPARREPANR